MPSLFIYSLSRLSRTFHSRYQMSSLTSAREEARWSRLARSMDSFHRYFRYEFNEIYDLADGSFSKAGMGLPMYLAQAEGLKKHLYVHHNIEETYLFPILAKRMPMFADNDAHRTSHVLIHEGLDRLEMLLREFRNDSTKYSPERMRDCLNSFRDVLMKHLDDEVHDLEMENLKKYWTLEEVDRILPH